MGHAQIKSDSPLELWLNTHRPIFDVFLDAYCLVDPNGNIVEFNIAFSELVGESHRKIFKIGQFNHLITFQENIDIISRVCLSKSNLRLDEVKASSKAFSDLNLIIGAVPVFSENKEFLGVLLTIRNVTAEMSLQVKYDERKKAAATDGLTQLFNKKHMEELICRHLKNSFRSQVPLTIVMSDIDHFKKVNDTYGHPAGDYILKEVASQLKGISRETDQLGRFGGEEFIILLYNTPEEGARVFCEKFRKLIESSHFNFEEKSIPITLSLGSATYDQPWQQGMEPEALMKELIHQADSALYDAKKEGRNRLVQFRRK